MCRRTKLFLLTFLLLFNVLEGWSERRIETINVAWKFTKDKPSSEWLTGNYNDETWQRVNIPHTWNNQDADDELSGYYRGDGWYRKYISVDSVMNGKQVDIYFEGANQITELWVNGQHVGIHKGGYTRFNFDITDYLRFGQKNIICIRVNNAYNPDVAPLSADFTFFGGIYRDIYLRYKEPVHIATDLLASKGVFISTPDVSEEEATLCITTHIVNKSNSTENIILEHTVFDEKWNSVAQFTDKQKLRSGEKVCRVNDKIILKKPNLWSPDSPYLYKVLTKIINNKGDVIDVVHNPLGLRWFEFHADNGFYLNGQKMKLIGTNRHQDFHKLGNALSDEKHLRDIKMIKDMGSNFLRVSHYPQDPVVLETCDRIGLLTSVEIPIVNAITESEEFTKNTLHMAREMVLQDYNHPSVIIWSYMNEVMLRPPFKNDPKRHAEYNKSVGKLGAKIESLIRKEDPFRYTIIPFHGNYKAYEDAELTGLPMIHGWNLYQGWYSGRFSGFGDFLDTVKERHPDKPQMITEYGADVDPRLHSFEPERFDFTAEYANLYHYAYLDAIMERDFVVGATIWNLNDFYSESRADAVPHVNNKGIVSTDRKLKDTYLYYQTIFNPEPAVRFASRNWSIRGGIARGSESTCRQTITIFSNMPQIEVFHNGTSLGNITIKNHRATIDIPFVNGNNVLVAETYDRGKKISDILNVDFRLTPEFFNNPNVVFEEVNIMLGSKRFFEDVENSQIWIPEKEYVPGSWGYIGGKEYTKKTKYGSQPSSEIDILGTEINPVFQTQRVGIEHFKADVPDGRYSVYLYWAELESDKQREVLAYNLGNDAIDQKIAKRVFDVKVNNQVYAENLNLESKFGGDHAVIKKYDILVKDGKGIDVNFGKVIEEPVLNAIRIHKIY